jgi:hypothetical protein
LGVDRPRTTAGILAREFLAVGMLKFAFMDNRPCLMSMARRAVVLGAIGMAPAPLHAQTVDPVPRPWERRIENSFAFVLNPLGIQDALDVTWTKRLNDRAEPLHRDAHVAAGVSLKATPAFGRLGAWLEYSPLSIIDLRAGVEPVYYFGTYKAFLPFASASARFDDDVIQARRPEAASGFAHRLYAAPALKAKAASVIMRVRSEISWWRAEDAGEPFFYEPAWDTLIQASGSTMVTVEALALREFKLSGSKTLLLGPVYEMTRVSDGKENRKQSISLLAVWSKPGTFLGLKNPTVALKGLFFLEDPWRRHEPAAQLALVFGL